tara:strand:+ start:94 stop:1062 length:969 start_codon:yes stop_codon:yes gene_type:complete
MKLFYIEDKYILIYRFVIVLVLTITISVSILGGIYGVTKWSGLLSGTDKLETKDNDFQKPNKNQFLEKFTQQKTKPKIEKKVEKTEPEEKDKDNDINKDVLFKQQAERLASLQKAFMDKQQKEFANLELTTLKNNVLRIIKQLEIPVLCDKKNEEKTKSICDKTDLKSKRLSGNRLLLKLDTIDVTDYSNNFYNNKINYFELQYSFVSDILTNEIAIEAYKKGKIVTPTINAINSFHTQFSSNNREYWKTRSENIKIEKENEQNSQLKKINDQAEALQILMYSAGSFGIFISIMFFVIFYRIERNLNKISELNMNVLENLKK